MSSSLVRVRRPRAPWAVPALCGLLLTASVARPEDKPSSEDKPSVARIVGHNQSPAGMLLRYDSARKSWRSVQPNGAVEPGDRLMVLPGARADVDFPPGIRLTLWGNTPELAAVPLLETVVQIDRNPRADLDITLERGRVLLGNRRGKEVPRVRVAFLDQVYEVRLTEPEAEVVVDVFSRWPPGIPFTRRPGPQDVPSAVSGVFVLKGDATLKVGSNQYLLRAPPGPASFHWDSLRGADVSARHRDSAPAWARIDVGDENAHRLRTALERLSGQLVARPVATVLAEARDDADVAERQLAVYAMGALDDLPGLVDALGEPRHADVREAAVEALRQWTGRAPGHDARLFDILVERRKYSESQAETVLQLLHGFSEEDRGRADTYVSLIAYLRSGRLPIRTLAWSYLARWAPSSREDAPFDPAGPEQDRERAYKAWNRLLAEGKLPPKGQK